MRNYLSLIKFSHTLFALPFALIGTVLGYKDGFAISLPLVFKILLCMVLARSAAMAFNRWADANYDKLNPRTANREIPAGIISSSNAIIFVITCCILFISVCYWINPVCFYLSPVALITVLGYSFTKRWTSLCHLILGAGLSLAPIGAYLAVTGKFSIIPLIFSGIVFYWVAGFDIIYALQDEEFDRSLSLHSIPAWLGKPRALVVSRVFHGITAGLMIWVSYLMLMRYSSLGMLCWVGAIIFIGLLFYQQRLVKPNDLSKVNLAFFTTNGIASVAFGIILTIDLLS